MQERTLFGPRLRPLAVLLALAPAAVSAAAWQHLESREPLPYHARFIARGSAGAIWSFDNAVIRRSATDGSTTTVFRNAARRDFDAEFFNRGIPTVDGGLIAYDAACDLQRITPDGRAVWRHDAALRNCKLRIAADGTSWIGGTDDGDEVHQIGADGVLLARRRAGGNEILDVSPDTLVDLAALDGGGAVELTRSPATNDAAVSRRGADANLLWRTNLPGAGDRAQVLAHGADGSADVVGVVDLNLWISHVDAQGSLARTRSLGMNASNVIVATERALDGALFVITGEAAQGGAYPQRLLRFGVDGALAWEQDLCANAPPEFWSSFQRSLWDVADDGSVANVCGDTLVVRRPDGKAQTLALPFQYPYQVEAGDDGEWLALGAEPELQSARLFAVGAETHEISLGAATEPEARVLLAAAITADGSSYLLSEGESGTQLTRLAPDGATRWSRHVGVNTFSAHVEARAGTVCVGHSLCLREADGVPLAPDLSPNSDATLIAMRPIEGIRAVRVVAESSTFRVVRINASDTKPVLSGTGRVHNIGIAVDGSFTLAIDDRVERYALDGRLLFRIERSPITRYQEPFVAAANGEVYVSGLSRLSNEQTSWAIDTTGATRWLVALPLSGDNRTTVATEDAVYVQGFFAAGLDYVSSYTVKLARDDGRTLWSHPSISRPTSVTRSRATSFALSANEREVAILGGGGERLHLERLDASTGNHIAELSFDCGGRCSQPAAFALDANGEARAAYTLIDRAANQNAAARSLGKVLQNPPAPTRLDQPGITGAWWASYQHGEGFTFDWLPASRTLFGAWFTYSAEGGNHPAQLRWYTLQADGIPANTTRLELPILATTAGNFAIGPSVSPRRVGLAKLTFTDCNNGTLEYDFDGIQSGGRSGTIALSRLTPSSLPCVLADGSTVPPPAMPPANGFDTRLSGTWFDESAIGQGLQFTVQPGGVFFAPWFTFDPAGAANDAGKQHWFTLQGDLAAARDGVASLVLVQTLGGTFDRVPTYNANAVGSATVRVLGCGRAELDYRFDDTSGAGAFRARHGTLQLTRAGGCAQ
jgi:hypothetical protein